jgi:hypothetical protein
VEDPKAIELRTNWIGGQIPRQLADDLQAWHLECEEMAGVQAQVAFKDVQELGYRPRKDNIAQRIRSLHSP